MSDSEDTGGKYFSDIVKTHKNWKRRLSSDEVGKIVRLMLVKLLKVSIPGVDISKVTNYPKLEKIVADKLDKQARYSLKSNVKDKEFDSLEKLSKVAGWVPLVKNILKAVSASGSNTLRLFVPVEKVEKKDVAEGIVVPDEKEDEKYESRSTGIDKELVELAKNSLDDVHVKGRVTEPGENQQENVKQENVKQSEFVKSKPVKTPKELKEMLKAKTVAEMFKGPSRAEEFEKLITEIAKDKSLMSLPKEQFQDYLKSKLNADDKNVDAITEAVIAKRAELLDKNKLKRDQLTEFDVENLQEQSQRDFERKMHDQNLRYILPAMLDKRDRLVVNRLNPELLKCGY